MGWSSCGSDSKGRNIGYGHAATCDHPGCDAKIDRGLAYACGGMHGPYTAHHGWEVCEGYFCTDHLVYAYPLGDDGPCERVCRPCEAQLLKDFESERLQSEQDDDMRGTETIIEACA